MDERLRVPLDAEYTRAIGLAVIAFARLEWDAVWCSERLQPGYIQTIEPARKTAGIIANDLRSYFLKISDSALRDKVVPYSEEFRSIVVSRNALLHGKPGTAPNGNQRLFSDGKVLSMSCVHEFSDRCVVAGQNLNELLYSELAEPCHVMLDP